MYTLENSQQNDRNRRLFSPSAGGLLRWELTILKHLYLNDYAELDSKIW